MKSQPSKQPKNFRNYWGREGYDKVERLHNAGLSPAAIAEALGRTERSVRRVLANIKLDDALKLDCERD